MPLPIYNSPILSIATYKDSIKLDPSIVLSTDIKGFVSFLKRFEKADMIALDIETTAFTFKNNDSFVFITNGALDPFQNYIRLLQVGLPDGSVLIIDFGAVYSRVPYQEEAKLLAKFFPILADKLADEKVQILGQNLKFDCTTLNVKFNGELVFTSLRDTFLMSKIYWSGVGIKKVGKNTDRSERGIPGFHSLGKIAERLGIKVDKSEQLSDWSKPKLTNSQLNYAANDVRVLFSIYPKMRYLVHQDGLSCAVKAEFDFLAAIIDIEFNGYPVCKNTLVDYLQKYEDSMQECIDIWNEYSNGIDIQKTKKDIIPVFSELGIDIESCAKDDLALLNHPAAQALLEYRGLKKSHDYLASTLKCINNSESSGLGNRLRTRFNQIAVSWRTSCTGKISGTNFKTGRRSKTNAPLAMNVQQIPNLSSSQKKKGLPNIRNIFKAPDGNKIIISDLSQAHSRIAAQYFKDPLQLSIYNEGKDGHLLVATELLKKEGFDLTFEEVIDIYNTCKHKASNDLTELENQVIYKRKQGKTGFYAFLNQSGAKTMQIAFKGYGIDVTEEFCKELIGILRKVYGGLYHGIKNKMKYVNASVKEGGIEYDFSKYFDDKGNPIKGMYSAIRGLPHLKYKKSNSSRNFLIKSKNTYEFTNYMTGKPEKKVSYQVAYTDAISFMWLSSEAVIIKQAVGNLYKEFKKPSRKNWNAHLVSFVHDQVDVECDGNYAEEVASFVGKTFKESLEDYIDVIPVEEFEVNYSDWIGQSMGDLH